MKSMTPQPERWISNFVDGRFVEPDERRGYLNIDPATGTEIAQVHEADQTLVDRAVASARRALASWADTPVPERTDLLRRAAARIEDRLEEFVAAEVADTGKPISQVREVDMPRTLAHFRTFADVVAAAGQESFLTELPHGRRALNYGVRKPLGVVAVIVPWNMPLLLLTWKIAPALGCGNAVVVKPSEETPSTATLLADVLTEVGLPAGVYNVVHGFGVNSAGEFLITHPGIDGITFTGSSQTGSSIMKAVAPRVRPVSLELGGKNAAVVFDDVDQDDVLAGLTRAVFSNTGQVCLATERVYVQHRVFDTIAAGLVDRARALRMGHPLDAATTTGPLISQTHRRKVLSYFETAEQAGAQILTGGGVPELGRGLDDGSWVEPTLWTGLTNADRTTREEIFGPVAALIPFGTEEEAIALANDTEYGLVASVWTNDLQRGHRVAQAMNVGTSWVNTWSLRDPRSSFGGMGLSGIGHEGGESSLNFYTKSTNVCMQL